MDVRSLLFPPGATRHDWAMDAALATALALLTIPTYWSAGSLSTLALLSSILLVIPLVLRRHTPLITLSLVSFAALLQLIASPLPLPSLVAIPIVSYSVARWVPGRAARLVVLIGSVGAILGPWRWVVPDPAHLNLRQVVWFALAWFVCMGLVVTPYAIGRRAREESTAHEHLVANAEERYRSLATEREQLARLAESRARTQIARELHDIVAHSLSVMIVQAEGGRALAAKKPEAATQALTTIADTGREALVEMRRILGVLREEPNRGDTDFAPAPRLADIPDLVQRTGDRFTLVVNGPPPKVPAALELTVYRVVQEALTNVLKHAGSQARATVTLTYSPREITIDVLDNGSPSGEQPSTQHGHGLRGMHERVTSMGGRMVARPRPSGGFQVTVVLPLPAAPLR